MKSYHQRNCRLRNLAYKVTDSVIHLIQQQPSGTTFWYSLPKTGKHNRFALRKAIAASLLHSFFSPQFLASLLQAALTPEGRPVERSYLYHWLLIYVYSNDVKKLYSDWLSVKDTVQQNEE